MPKSVEILLKSLNLLEARMLRVLHSVDTFDALILFEHLEDVFGVLAY